MTPPVPEVKGHNIKRHYIVGKLDNVIKKLKKGVNYGCEEDLDDRW